MLRLGEILPNSTGNHVLTSELQEVQSPINDRRSFLFPEYDNKVRRVYIPSYMGGHVGLSDVNDSDDQPNEWRKIASELGNIAEFFIYDDQIQWQSDMQRTASFLYKINIPTYNRGLYTEGLQDRCRFMT